MKPQREKTISTRVTMDDYNTVQDICTQTDETPARIFRKLITTWLSENKKKPKNKC